ncbi:MFS transporter [Phenylobacterium sp.]|uniref:spinster family MFS transporter n=1 Tax=Phenylobacterium sp. TaxID=1871053 RepID=UPI002F423876
MVQLTLDEPEVGKTAARPGRARRAWLLSLLTTAFGLNLLDRQVINVLAEPIKHDLHLADWQLGALTGLSFAILYGIAGLPIARVADRGDRVRVIGLAVLAWSVFTAACGLAANFWQLLVLRVGVGLGEAGCSPPSQSLIADHYPPAKRAGALATFFIGSPVGASLGLLAGGILADSLGWRGALICAGGPGLLIGLLALTTLKDPPHGARAPQLPLYETLASLAARRSFVWLAMGYALLSFMNYECMTFAGSYFLRVHGADLAVLKTETHLGPIGLIGAGMGLSGMLFGALGSVIGGWLGDRYGPRDPRNLALIPALGSLVCTAGYVAMFTAPGAWGLLVFVVPSLGSNLWAGPGTLAFQKLAGPRARATVMAVVLLASTLIGMGLGPLSVGVLSDVYSRSLGAAEGLRAAVLTGLVAGGLSVVAYAFGSRRLAADLDAAQKAEGSAA